MKKIYLLTLLFVFTAFTYSMEEDRTKQADFLHQPTQSQKQSFRKIHRSPGFSSNLAKNCIKLKHNLLLSVSSVSDNFTQSSQEGDRLQN